MAPKRKPGGLKKSAAASSESLPAQKSMKADKVADNNDTMAIPLASSEADEVAEINEMFELALLKLDSAQDIEEGASLLRGVIHESDRVLRSRFELNSSANDQKPLPATFHLTYGSALFRLGLLVAEDEESKDLEEGSRPVDYIAAAIDRYETGVDSLDNDDVVTAWKLDEAIGRAIIEKVSLTLKQDETFPFKNAEKPVSEGLKHLSQALKRLESCDSNTQLLDESVSIILVFLRVAEMTDHYESGKKYVNMARVELNGLLKVDPTHVGTLITLGQTYMNAANDLLDASENGDEKVELANVTKLVDEAYKYLLKAEEESQKNGETNIRLQLLLGEVYVNKANLLDEAENEDEADKFYKKAVTCFKTVEKADASALPDAFDTFLREWESEMN